MKYTSAFTSNTKDIRTITRAICTFMLNILLEWRLIVITFNSFYKFKTVWLRVVKHWAFQDQIFEAKYLVYLAKLCSKWDEIDNKFVTLTIFVVELDKQLQCLQIVLKQELWAYDWIYFAKGAIKLQLDKCLHKHMSFNELTVDIVKVGSLAFQKISKCHLLQDIEKSFQEVTTIGPEPHQFFSF